MSSALRSVDLLHHRCDSAVGVVPLFLLPLKVVETKVGAPLQPPGSGLAVAWPGPGIRRADARNAGRGTLADARNADHCWPGDIPCLGNIPCLGYSEALMCSTTSLETS